MKINVLIIDDEWQDRKKAYEYLEKIIIKSGYDIRFDFFQGDCRSDLQAKYLKGGYSAVITDAILNIKWPTLTIRDVADIIDDDIPMAVLSGKWGADNINEVRFAFKKPNCRTFLHWRDIDGDENMGYGKHGEIEYARESIIRMLSESEGLDVNLDLDAGDDIRIVHISDVHARIGSMEGGDEFEQRILNDVQNCAYIILEHWGNKRPTFIAFTGDVADYGSQDQYNIAEKWIGYFIDRLRMGSLPSRKLLYVPGNHDINISLATAARIRLNIQKEELRPEIMDEIQQHNLINYSLFPFYNYLSRITDCPLLTKDYQMQNFGWLETRFRHLGIVFYGVKTSKPSSFTLPERKIDLDVLRQLGEKINAISNENPIVIGLGHHSPVPVAQADGAVTNISDLKKYFLGLGKTHIFLHGHCHETKIEDYPIGSSRLVLSGAPSLSEEAKRRPEDTLRGFNLLTLHRKNNKINSMKIDAYSWIGGSPQLMSNLSRSYVFENDKFICQN